MITHVIGTAGHIDHGKSTLVKALTGIDPDRLKEEKERQMTIDLGFAHLTLPSGKKVSIVDVPGHERFIRNMLAGASGIDLVLFVVAADEGMMPQSREHLDILNLLQLKNGVIVLTKTDLVDEEWLELVEVELKEEVKGTFLENSPVIRVSSVTGSGIDELKNYIDRILDKIEKRPVDAPARYYIDRVFNVAGFGLVVTGTLWEGKIKAGEDLDLHPHEKKVRVRNLQTHNENVSEAVAAVRLAINISGTEKTSVQRGDALAESDYYRPTRLIDAELKMLPDSPVLAHAEKVHFYLGTKETVGRVRVLYQDELKSGEKGYVQILLQDPVIARRSDRFIIRRFSPLITIGGGVVLNPYPKRKRLNEERYLEEFKILEKNNMIEVLLYYLENSGFEGVTIEDLKIFLCELEERVLKALNDLSQERKVFKLSDRYFSLRTLEKAKQRVLKEAETFFKKNPWAPSMDKEELRNRSRIDNRKFYSMVLDSLAEEGKIVVASDSVNLPCRSATFTAEEGKIKTEIEKTFLKNMFNPPLPEDVISAYESKSKIAKKMFDVLVAEGTILKISSEVYMHRDSVEEAKKIIRAIFAEKERVRIGEIRDRLNTSRKYVVPLMEYFDKMKFTRRVGEERILLDR